MNKKSNLKIYNTLSKRKEIFQSIQKQHVGIYVCGMTVYDYCHIGNARVNVFFDFVVRYLRFLNYDVIYVRNITDIDDKIIKRAYELNQTSVEVAQRFTAAMHEDMQKLGVNAPTYEPKVTEHISDVITIIKTLLDKKYAYIAANGDVYYDTDKFKSYGELAHQDLDNLKAGARVEVNEAKHHPLDFVLWKMAKPQEPSWSSPWGNGRPGWHIECSAMSRHYLGDCFDIHGGGIDLQFPHHQNELAQSEAACSCKFVNYWLHVGFVSVDNEKMSKSLGNFFTVREVLQHYQPEVLRFFLLMAHYRSPLNYATENLEMAKAALTRMYTALRGLSALMLQPSPLSSVDNISIDVSIGDNLNNNYLDPFLDALNDDFNIPLALGHMFELVRYINRLREQLPLQPQCNQVLFTAVTMLRDKMGAILGILQQDPEQFFQLSVVDVELIQRLIDERLVVRENKNWARADQIREQLKNMGIVLEDNASGTSWRKRD